jgi:hypothetical protein
MGRSSVATRRVVFVGAGIAVSAVLAVLQTDVLSLHLLTPIKWVVSVLFTALVALISTVSSDRARRADAAMKVSSINSALIGGAGRLLRYRRLDELGVTMPDEETPAVRREDLATIDAGLERSWLVCVIGPDRDGTAAAAFTALRARAPDARLIAPVDADGLGTVLDGGDALRSALAQVNGAGHRKEWWSRLKRARCGPLVVWLDGFARFASKLDGDGLRRFIHDTDAAHAQNVGPHGETAKIRLLATMRASDYDTLLSGEGEDALRARRLLAQARLVWLPAVNIPEGWSPPHDVGQATDDEKPYGAVDPLSPASALNGTFGVLSLFTALLVIALLALAIYHRGFTAPPTLDAQARTVEDALPSCETAAPLQPAGSVADGGDWVLPVQAGSCPRSDYVSIYANDAGHLDPVLTERPISREVWIFRCALTTDCAVSAGGRRTLIIGAFMHYSGVTQIALPIILYADTGPTDVRLLAPSLPPPNNHVAAITLRLGSGAVSDLSSQSVCARPAELCGAPPTYITALPAGTEASQTSIPANAVLLIAGYAQSGSYYQPKRVVTRAFVLQYSKDNEPPVRFGPTPCTSTTGKNHYTIKHPPSGVPDLLHKMRKSWTGAISCPALPRAGISGK